MVEEIITLDHKIVSFRVSFFCCFSFSLCSCRAVFCQLIGMYLIAFPY